MRSSGKVDQPYPTASRGHRPTTIFAAAPSRTPSRSFDSDIDTLRFACVAIASRTGWEINMLTGADAGSSDPKEIREFCRDVLLHEAEAFMAIHGPSWGASREEALASHLGLPRFVAYPAGEIRSVHGGPDGSDALLDEATYADRRGLQRAAEDWLQRSRKRIVTGSALRRHADAIGEPDRNRLLRIWETLEEGEQEHVAALLGLVPHQVGVRLMDARDYCAMSVRTQNLLAELMRMRDVVHQRIRAEAEAVLSPTQERNFDIAVGRRPWWDEALKTRIRAEALRELRPVREEDAAGMPARAGRYNTHFEWLTLGDRLCGEPGT